VDRTAVAFFEASTWMVPGNGHRLCFWTNRWLKRCSIAQLVPDVTATVPKLRWKTHSVESGLVQGAWMQDIQGARMLPVLIQYLEIRQRLKTIQLNPESDDRMVWRWTSSDTYSSSSAYLELCLGQSSLLDAKEQWKARAPGKCNFSFVPCYMGEPG
jgi:hypothetical protein